MDSGWRVPGFTEIRELGAGGQGRAVLVSEDVSGRTAVLKYVFAAADPSTRDLFRRESVLLKRVVSPYVAQWYGHYEDTAGSAILMEAVDGCSLRSLLAERGPLTPEAALTVLKGSLLGLAAAHTAGVVHRDYKPANVVVRGDGLSKLIDFGVAVLHGESSRSGTPAYMAPEQWRGDPASPATDIYAATCVFFECLTGHKPYEETDSQALAARHATSPAPVEQVPPPLRPLLERGLAKLPALRAPDATAFVAELEAAATSTYGPQWETRGITTLATAAAALAALFPLAALTAGAGTTAAGTAAGGSMAGGTTAGGTTAGGTAAGGSAAGGTAAGGTTAGGTATGGSAAGGTTAGGSAGGGGLGQTVGSGVAKAVTGKVALGIAGTAVVAIGGTAAVVVGTGGDHKKKPPIQAEQISVAVRTTDQSFTAPRLMSEHADYVTVSGMRDTALQAAINRKLAAPVDARIAYIRKSLAGYPADQKVSADKSQAQILLRTKQVISVRYTFTITSDVLSHPTWGDVTTITVALKTGRSYAGAETFKPGVSVAALNKRIEAYVPNGSFCGTLNRPYAKMTRASLGTYVHPVFAADHVEVDVNLPGIGYETACGIVTAKIPYPRFTDLLAPDLVGLLPLPAVPSPTSS